MKPVLSIVVLEQTPLLHPCPHWNCWSSKLSAFFFPMVFPQAELFILVLVFCSHPLPCTQDRLPGCCSLPSLGRASPGLRHSDATCIRSRMLLCLGWECCQGLVFLLTAVSTRSQYLAVSSHGEGQVSLQAEVLQ